MPVLVPFTIAVSKLDWQQLSDWQAAINAQDFLVPLRLEILDFSRDRTSVGHFAERRVEFTAERRSIADVVRPTRPDLVGEWSYAYAFRGDGNLDSSLAANVVALAYASATGGTIFDLKDGPRKDTSSSKQALDVTLASALDRVDLLAARYPELMKERRESYDTLVTRVWIGDEVVSETSRPLSAIKQDAARRRGKATTPRP
jgi:hypothetical protein